MLDDLTTRVFPYVTTHKSDVQSHVVDFIAYVHTQFGRLPKCVQADNGTEFVNNPTTS